MDESPTSHRQAETGPSAGRPRAPTPGPGRRRSLTARVLVALATGLASGIVLSAVDAPLAPALIGFVEPVGTLWVQAIRMTVIPLVVASVIVGIAAAPDPRTIGRIGGRALVIIGVALVAAATLTIALAPPLLRWLPIDPASAAALRASAADLAGDATATALPGFADWLLGLVPVNPIRAAADGAILPLIIFSLALGLAATRLTAERRRDLLGFFQALADAMLTLVRWVLDLAPIGVFALALPLAARLGIAAAGAIAYYIALTALLCLVTIAGLHLAAAVFGGVPPRRFAHASAPAQAVAFSSRSSLASLPAMIEAAETRLGLPAEVGRFFLPLAASTFRISATIAQCLGVLFIARLYDIPLLPSQLATVGVISVLTSFSVPGIPAGVVIVMLPALIAAGLPVEGIGILLGVDTIPDMFRTTTNVTADMAAAAILGRSAADSTGTVTAPYPPAGPNQVAVLPDRGSSTTTTPPTP